MLKDKYDMTMQENIFYAKRNIVDSIWKSANLIEQPGKLGVYDVSIGGTKWKT